MHFIFLIVREQSCASALKNIVLCKIVCLFDLEQWLNSIFLFNSLPGLKSKLLL